MNRKFKDETGNKFGLLTVLHRVDNPKGNGAQFMCRCTCGARKIFKGRDLRAGHNRTCGSRNCKRLRRLAEWERINGKTGTDDFSNEG